MPHAPGPEAGTLTRRSFRRAPGEERRQDLLRATLDCVAERGLQATTVREIAVRAGVTGGLIRYYFACKDQMILEAYRSTMAEMTALAKEASQKAEYSAGARLAGFVAANLSPPILDIRRLTLWASFISMIHVDAAMAAIHHEHYLAFRDELETLAGAVLAEARRPADAGRCRDAAIKINAAIDGLWLEGTLAPALFASGNLIAMGIETVEAILGLRLRAERERI